MFQYNQGSTMKYNQKFGVSSLAVITIAVMVTILVSTAAADWKDWFKGKPSLTDKQKQWVLYPRELQSSSNSNFPFQYGGHGYKFIRIYKVAERKTSTSVIPESYKIEWGWKLTVKNVDSVSHDLHVDYILKDIDRFTVMSDLYFSDLIGAGETVTLRSTTSDTYEKNQIQRVYYGTWSLEFGTTSSSRNLLKSLEGKTYRK